MRIDVLADILSNLWALTEVPDDTRTRSVDAFMSLRDILYGPLNPWETFELLQRVELSTVRGNQDREIYGLPTSVSLAEGRYSTLGRFSDQRGLRP